MEKKQEELKVLNVRTQKWRQMLKEKPFKDLSLVKNRVRKGIPPGMRQMAWPRLVDLERFKAQSQESYEILIKQKSSIEGEIRLDIPRTYTEEKAQLMRASLFDVLKALSLVYPELGYCQGMNHLSMKLLETLNDETGFWMMNYLIRTYRNIMWAYKNPSTTELQNSVLLQLMNKYTPQMAVFLAKQSIQLTAFTPRWFITLFSSTLPTQLFYRVFECFLMQGYKIIYKAALTMIKITEPLILNQPYEQVLGYLMKKQQYQNINPDEFCSIMHSFTFTSEYIDELEQKFMSKNPQRLIEWQQQAQKSYQRRIKDKLLAMDEVSDERINNFPPITAEFKKAPFELYRLQ